MAGVNTGTGGVRADGRGVGRWLLAALLAAAGGSATLFVGWFAAFAVMGLLGRPLLVGMYFLAWPVAFPLLAFPVYLALFLPLIRLGRGPFLALFESPRFVGTVLVPLYVGGLLVMFATCPLETGGTLWSRGGEGFGHG